MRRRDRASKLGVKGAPFRQEHVSSPLSHIQDRCLHFPQYSSSGHFGKRRKAPFPILAIALSSTWVCHYSMAWPPPPLGVVWSLQRAQDFTGIAGAALLCRLSASPQCSSCGTGRDEVPASAAPLSFPLGSGLASRASTFLIVFQWPSTLV